MSKIGGVTAMSINQESASSGKPGAIFFVPGVRAHDLRGTERAIRNFPHVGVPAPAPGGGA